MAARRELELAAGHDDSAGKQQRDKMSRLRGTEPTDIGYNRTEKAGLPEGDVSFVSPPPIPSLVKQPKQSRRMRRCT